MDKKRLLIVDDEPSMTKMLKRNLEAGGKYEVHTENNSTLALAAAKAFKPDLVLLDVMMPDMDGGEVAAALQDDPATKGIPVVFLTAAITREEAQRRADNATGREFLAKPVVLQELLAVLAKYLPE